MNKYLAAIYRNDEHSLSSHLYNRSGNDSKNLNEALRVVLGDSELELTLRYRYAEMLLLGGADPNTADWDQAPLLSLAVERDDLVMLQLLLDFACDVNMASDRGRSPLHEAALLGRAGIAGLLMASGASVNRTDEDGDTPLMSAVRGGDSETMELMLIEGNVKATNANGETALHHAAAAEDGKAAELLVKAGVPLDVVSSTRQTALSIAVRYQNIELVDILLDAGAAVHIPASKHGDTTNVPVLHDAARSNNCDLIEKLVTHGANLNAVCSEYLTTPLQTAVLNSCTEAVCILLRYNSNPNVYSTLTSPKKKVSLLHQAISKKDYMIIKMLLLAGARFAQEDLGNITALLFSDMILKNNESWNSPEGKLLEVETCRKITSLPLSLKQLSRLVVRDSVGTCTHQKIGKLDIPKALQEFVMLKELEELV